MPQQEQHEKISSPPSSSSSSYLANKHTEKNYHHNEYHDDQYSNSAPSSSFVSLEQQQQHPHQQNRQLNSCPLFMTSSSSLSSLISLQNNNTTTFKRHCCDNDIDYNCNRFKSIQQEEKNNNINEHCSIDKIINQQKVEKLRSLHSCPLLLEKKNDTLAATTNTTNDNNDYSNSSSKPSTMLIITLTSILMKKIKCVLQKSYKIITKHYKTKFGQSWLILSAVKNYKFLLTFYYPIPLFGIIAALYPTFFSLFQPNSFDYTDVVDSSMMNDGDDDNDNGHYGIDNTTCDNNNDDNTEQKCHCYNSFCSNYHLQDDDRYHHTNLSPFNTVAVEFSSSSDEWGHFADFFEDEHHHSHHHHNIYSQHNRCNNNIDHNLVTSSFSLVQSSS